MTPTVAETGELLRLRVARTAEAATGIACESWLRLLGPVVPTPASWVIDSYRGDPTSAMIARRIAREVAEHFGYAPVAARTDGDVALFGWPADATPADRPAIPASARSRSS